MSFYQDALDSMLLPGQVTVMQDGSTLRNSYSSGAAQVRMPSQAAVAAAMGAANDKYFVNNFAANLHWLLAYAALGNVPGNHCIEVRRSFGQVLRESTRRWQFAWVNGGVWGKRVFRADDNSGTVGTQARLAGNVLRVVPSGSYGYELWPDGWDGAIPGVTDFWGRIDGPMWRDGRAWCFGAQVRVGLINPGGTDDRSNAKYGIQVGHDGFSVPYPGWRYKANNGTLTNSYGAGFPYGAFDGSFSRWVLFDGDDTDWKWVICLPGEGLWTFESDLPPPWGNWSSKIWWNRSPYAVTRAELDANPPLTPPPIDGETEVPDTGGEGDTGSGSNLIVVDAKFRRKTPGEALFLLGAGNSYEQPATGVVTDVDVSPATVTFTEAGQTQQLTPTVIATGGLSTDVTYSVTGAAVTVSPTGLVTAVQAGSAVIKVASVADPTVIANVQVIVALLPGVAPSQLLELTRLPMRTRGYKG